MQMEVPAFAAALFDTPAYSTADLLAHPEFDRAFEQLCNNLATMWGDHRRIVRTLFDLESTLTYMVSLCVAANEIEGRPETYLTITSLIRWVGMLGVTGDRNIRRMIDGFRSDGLMVAEPLAEDRRNLRLRPTERMIQIDCEWMAAFNAPLATLYPHEQRYEAAVRQDRAFENAFRRIGLWTFSIAMGIMEPDETVVFFLRQTVGIRIMALMLEAAKHAEDGALPDGFMTAAARRSGTSRVHIRNVITAAQAQGLVTIDEARKVRLTDKLRNGARYWVAASLAGTDKVTAMADALMRKERGEG